MTVFTETEALLAVLNDDMHEAERLVRTLLPNEQRTLHSACVSLGLLIERTPAATVPE